MIINQTKQGALGGSTRGRDLAKKNKCRGTSRYLGNAAERDTLCAT